jgi:hypothetical protein
VRERESKSFREHIHKHIDEGFTSYSLHLIMSIIIMHLNSLFLSSTAGMLSGMLSSDEMAQAVFAELKSVIENHFSRTFRLIFRHSFSLLKSLN